MTRRYSLSGISSCTVSGVWTADEHDGEVSAIVAARSSLSRSILCSD